MDNEQRISPLRGLNHQDIISQTKVTKNGLSALRDDHYGILSKIRDEAENKKNDNDNRQENNNHLLLQSRIEHVTKSLESLEVGIEEAAVLLNLSEHFDRVEAERSTVRLEMGRVMDENDWLREELADTQRKLQEALLEVTQLQEEKAKWEFEEELRNIGNESNVRPITPSKIPVGSWRVEEEKDINRALNGGDKVRSASPAPSKIPILGRARSSAYRAVMEKEQAKKASGSAAAAGGASAGGQQLKRPQYFKLNANRTKIPAR